MAVSRESAQYCLRGIVNYLIGNTKEFEKLVNTAIEFNRTESVKVKCLYKQNGIKIKAFVDFSTGTVIDEQGNVLRRGKVC